MMIKRSSDEKGHIHKYATHDQSSGSKINNRIDTERMGCLTLSDLI